ncbi:hypothetical protein OUZ56_007860 [Daphnia magna]|uniref:Uncharacterized protein n=1 Tax=Daphnia magna TaxID=35525 RepID=A0ABR0AB78_9CRUS|nr:hypothetical protein OUZ56_007860 [Daphnia magna]
MPEEEINNMAASGTENLTQPEGKNINLTTIRGKEKMNKKNHNHFNATKTKHGLVTGCLFLFINIVV